MAHQEPAAFGGNVQPAVGGAKHAQLGENSLIIRNK